MANATDTARTLISDSVVYNRISHAEFSPELAAELELVADDSADNGAVVEYWGDDDGDEWRVHLERPEVE